MVRYAVSASIGAGLAVIAVLASAPVSGNTDQERPTHAPQSLCRADEQVLFQCRAGRRTVAVCAGQSPEGRFVQYRFGRPGHVELAYPARGSEGLWWARTGYSGGGELQINFRNEGHRYVLYSRVVRTGFGQGPNNPRFEAGVAVVHNNRIISDRRCTDTDDPWRAEPEHLLPEGEFMPWRDLNN